MTGSTDCRGVPLSTDDPVLIAELERIHEDSLAMRGDPVADVARLLRRQPDFVFALCFKAGMLTQSMETRVYPDLVAAVEAAEALWARANDRERGHIRAVRAWVEGDFHGAVQHWDGVLVENPRDLLALQLVHLTGVLLGDITNQRDCVARVFPAWDESVPGYGYVLGYYAFGLEEMRDFSRAEECGRRALALNHKDAYAIHAVAHVMEMQGRQGAGIHFLRERAPDWAPGNFSNHLWWHLSLFHLDLDQVDAVLRIYDDQLRAADPSGDRYQELDAAALLWRLTLLGVDVGSRWTALADKWAHAATDTLYAFNDVHAMMTFVADGRMDLAHTLLTANERYVEHAGDANVAMSRIIGIPFCKALCAFARGDYASTVATLMPLRYRTHRLGGSHAQRDILNWTLVEAALRAGQYPLGLALANERLGQKPTSPQNWRLRARALDGMGRQTECSQALAKAQSLLAA
ncbi:MAG: tetratricopeptide repeat protein [Rhodospirillaceae bacterium]|nr:tetratricopeptide repeat protein [Rhodospirillaceae bacterium]